MGESERSDRMSELIGRSSLGTNEARHIRSYTSPSDVAEVLKPAESRGSRGRQRALMSMAGMARRGSAPPGPQSSIASVPVALSVSLAGLWLVASAGAVTSGLLLVSGSWQLRTGAVWLTTAVLILGARRVGDRCRQAAFRGVVRIPPPTRPQGVSANVDDDVAEERSEGTTRNGGIQRH